MADGRYEVKVVADDSLANAPGTGRKAERISDPVAVDNTAPTIADLKASSGAGEVRVQFNAYDRSALAAFAYSVDSSTEAMPEGTYFSAQKRGPYSATNISNPIRARLRHWDAVGPGRPRRRMKP